MPLPSSVALTHFGIGGKMPQDVWEITFWTFHDDSAATFSQSQLDAFTLNVLNLFNTTVWNVTTTGLKNKNVAAMDLSSARATAYQGGVAYQTSRQNITPVPGAGSSGVQPAYAAVCITELTFTNDRRHRGRVYLPFTGAAPSGTDLQLVQTQMDQCTAQMKAFYDAVNGLIPAPMPDTRACVVSRAGAAVQGILTVRADSRVDTQRGREPNTALRYSTAALA